MAARLAPQCDDYPVSTTPLKALSPRQQTRTVVVRRLSSYIVGLAGEPGLEDEGKGVDNVAIRPASIVLDSGGAEPCKE